MLQNRYDFRIGTLKMKISQSNNGKHLSYDMDNHFVNVEDNSIEPLHDRRNTDTDLSNRSSEMQLTNAVCHRQITECKGPMLQITSTCVVRNEARHNRGTVMRIRQIPDTATKGFFSLEKATEDSAQLRKSWSYHVRTASESDFAELRNLEIHPTHKRKRCSMKGIKKLLTRKSSSPEPDVRKL